MMVIQSFAKNFGLYGQRVGCLSVPRDSVEDAQLMNGFFASRARRLYSTPPRFGSDIVKTVLSNPEMRA